MSRQLHLDIDDISYQGDQKGDNILEGSSPREAALSSQKSPRETSSKGRRSPRRRNSRVESPRAGGSPRSPRGSRVSLSHEQIVDGVGGEKERERGNEREDRAPAEREGEKVHKEPARRRGSTSPRNSIAKDTPPPASPSKVQSPGKVAGAPSKKLLSRPKSSSGRRGSIAAFPTSSSSLLPSSPSSPTSSSINNKGGKKGGERRDGKRERVRADSKDGGHQGSLSPTSAAPILPLGPPSSLSSSSFSSLSPSLRRRRAHSSPNTVAEFYKYDLSTEAIASLVRMQGMVRSYITKREREGRILSADSAYRKVFARYYDQMMYGNLKDSAGGARRGVKKKWEYVVHTVARLGKGILAGSATRCLAVENWLESVDPKHRYGHELRHYHKNWLQSESEKRFFQWLDYGEGRELSLPSCSRLDLEMKRVKYCTPDSRRQYEVKLTVKEEAEGGGKYISLSYIQGGMLVHTFPDPGKWIFVVGPDRKLYVNRKETGHFHHSSFLAGGCTMAAGKLYADSGKMLGLEPHSGHYRPSVNNLKALYAHLESLGADLSLIAFGRPKRWEGPWPFPDSQTSISKNCIEHKYASTLEPAAKYLSMTLQIVKLQKFYRRARSRREREGFLLSSSSPWKRKAKEIYEQVDGALPSLSSGGKWSVPASVTAAGGGGSRVRARTEGSPPLPFCEETIEKRGETGPEPFSPLPPLLSDASREREDGGMSPSVAMAKQKELSSWLEAVDTEHRTGKYLTLYHRRWVLLDTNDSFFTWLDKGDGKVLSLPSCSRLELEFNALIYCDASARQQFEVEMVRCTIDGKKRIVLRYKMGGSSVNSHPLWSEPPVPSLSPLSLSSSSLSAGELPSERGEREVRLELPQGESLREEGETEVLGRKAGEKTEREDEGDAYLLLIDEEDTVYVNKHIPGRFHFSSFLSGKRGKFAGEVWVDRQGRVRRVFPATGKFRPSLRQLREFMERFGGWLEIKKPKEWRGPWPEL